MLDLQKNPPSKILLINIFGIGDVLFTSPVIRNLKKNFPDAEIGYVCNRRTQSVLENHPDVDQCFIYERDEFVNVYNESKSLYWKKTNAFWNEIKSQGYDVVFDFSMNRFMSLFSKKIGIKTRIGYNYKNRGALLTHKRVLEGYEGKHIIDYYLDLLEDVNVEIKERHMDLVVDESTMQWADKFLNDLGVDSTKDIICIVPGGGASWGKEAKYKRWSAEGYGKLADKIIENSPATIILCGDDKEEALCQEVSSFMQHPAYIACGKTSIHQFAAILKRCSMAIVNDGGPLHIAVASGTKTISIFGPVDPAVYGPYPVENHIVITKSLSCQPCYRKFRRAACDHVSCLLDLDVQDVFQKVKGVL